MKSSYVMAQLLMAKLRPGPEWDPRVGNKPRRLCRPGKVEKAAIIE